MEKLRSKKMNRTSLVLTLLHLKGWGPKKIHAFASAYSFNYEKCVQALSSVLTNDEKVLFKQELENSKIDLKKNYDLGIRACSLFDKEFPAKLYDSTDKCVFLYYKGDISLLSKKSILIIGTRHPNSDFIEKGIKATSYFAERDYVVVSGLALGCDSIAHQACLDVGGKTIAVLPSSCDNIQPTSNRQLANKIVSSGGLLISEYGTGSPVTKFNYPKRDIIQSLLGSLILIIQTSNDGGTMIATRKNIKDGKLVYAIKGNNLRIVERYVDVDSIEELKEIEKHIY